ncbi:MAG: hypothetical protein JKY48_20700 [Flavobacteriales bacterium]|nr:hypothetical protein [Flavobacteriales bacterium]
MMRVFFCVLLLTTLVSCGTEKTKQNEDVSQAGANKNDANDFVERIESIHNKKLFMEYDAIQFDLNLNFKGKQKFSGRVYMTTDGQQIQAKGERKEMYWNGKKAMILPDTAESLKARSALFTWTHFFAAPYKLSEQSTKHHYLGPTKLGGDKYLASKMTFANSPDDSYVLYKGDNDLLVAMTYISKGRNKKESEPRAITYEAFTDLEGIPFATQWNFWSRDEDGNLDKLLGSASLGNIRFMKKAGDSFNLAASSNDR